MKAPCFLLADDKNNIHISFEEWMKAYKPFVVRIISPEVAQQWIEQADKIITYIKEKWAKSEAEVGDSKKMVYEEYHRNKN